MDVPSVKELFDIYYAVPVNVRANGEWRMSEAMLKALADAYATKPDDDQDEDKEPYWTTAPAMLFGKPIVIDERYPQPKIVKPIKTKYVVMSLTPSEVDQLLSALRNRGDDSNGDPEWRSLCTRLQSFADGFFAAEDPQPVGEG